MPALGEGVEDGDDLTQRPTEPREFADDQAVSALQDAYQLIEPAAFFGSLSRGGRLDKVVDAEVVLSRVLEESEALAAQVLLRGRNPQIGDGLHGLTPGHDLSVSKPVDPRVVPDPDRPDGNL